MLVICTLAVIINLEAGFLQARRYFTLECVYSAFMPAITICKRMLSLRTVNHFGTFSRRN